MITKAQNTPSMIPEKKKYQVCLDLHKLGFPFSHRDENSLYYIRPDMCIRRSNFDAILGEDGYQFSRWFKEGTQNTVSAPRLIDEVLFCPSYENLFKELEEIVVQITKTNAAGCFAYTSISDGDRFIRGHGATPWFALADAWIEVQKWRLTPPDIELDLPEKTDEN